MTHPPLITTVTKGKHSSKSTLLPFVTSKDEMIENEEEDELGMAIEDDEEALVDF